MKKLVNPRFKMISVDHSATSILHQIQNNISFEEAMTMKDRLKATIVGHKSALGVSWNQTLHAEKKNARICLVREKAGNDFLFLVNPHIIKYSQETSTMKEGCLSVLNEEVEKERSMMITLKHLTKEGWVEEAYSGFLARVIQHEVDHLNGITILDKGEKK